MNDETQIINVRPSTEQDRDFAKGVHHSAYHAVVVSQFGEWNEPLQDEFFSKFWSSAKVEIVLLHETPVGFFAKSERKDHIYILELVIDPRFQGQGIGSKILDSEITNARAMGLPLRLQVLKMNRAIELYRRYGFNQYRETGTHIQMELL